MREDRQLNRIVELITSYEGSDPLPHYLRKYFRQHSEMGSRDRRITSRFIYNYFRMGRALPRLSVVERIAVASFLIETVETELLIHILGSVPALHGADIAMERSRKPEFIKNAFPAFSINDLFPFKNEVSPLLDFNSFAMSMLQQPRTWLRSREPNTEQLIHGLNENGIQFIQNDLAIGIEQGTDIKSLNHVKEEWYEIQDLNSQRTGQFFKPNPGDEWYDCCAASGGKSLLLQSICSDVHLTVSDNRKSILENLDIRFKKNDIRSYQSFIADIEVQAPKALTNTFDGIIADVPCTGSGTWSRSPEQITFFKEEMIAVYAKRQEKIIEHVVPFLKQGKPLIYITCSVFETENEAVVNKVSTKYNLEIESQQLLQGSNPRADTLFAARLVKK